MNLGGEIVAVALERAPAWCTPVYTLMVEQSAATWEGGPFAAPEGRRTGDLGPHVFAGVVERVRTIGLEQWGASDAVIADMPKATITVVSSGGTATGWSYCTNRDDPFTQLVDHLDAIADGFGWGAEHLELNGQGVDRPPGVRPRPPNNRPAPTPNRQLGGGPRGPDVVE